MEDPIQSHPDDVQSLNTLCSLLGDYRRRYAIKWLSEQESPVGLTELASAVAAWENESEPADTPEKATNRVAATLHHVHLPKLDTADIIVYDTETKVVMSIQTEVFTPFLELLETDR